MAGSCCQKINFVSELLTVTIQMAAGRILHRLGIIIYPKI
jgi:hypothetical protein